MRTYALMALPFIAFVLLLDWSVLKTRVITRKDTWIIMGIMGLLTAVFDQLLTLPGSIVSYNEARISGVRVGFAPIEDFSYTIAVVILIGALLEHHRRRTTPDR